VYPNPTNDHIFITGKGTGNNNLKIVIADVTGKTIMEKQIRSNDKVELDLKSGLYLVSITNQNNEKTVKKLIISK
jgi:hypothetical protein